MADEMTFKLVKTQPENDDTTSVFIGGGPMDKLRERRAGQFATIRVMGQDGEWSRPHPFTISCEPEEEDAIRFTVKRAGQFTAGLRDLPPGTLIQCSGPMGAFCKDIDRDENIVMVAGGVGVTPFLSVLRHFRRTKAGNDVHLFWGNKTLADAFAAEELQTMTEQLNLTVVHALSRQTDLPPDPSPKVHYASGRLNKDLMQEYLPHEQASFYLCGPPGMQDGMLAELEACGIGRDRVAREAFGK